MTTTNMRVNLRAIVLDILMELNKPDSFSHVVIGNALTKYQYLDKQERSFITRLAVGTVEKRIELDYIIDTFSKTPSAKQKPLIRAVLEMSVYQLKYMDGVPESAVCNEAVKLVQKRGFSQLKGFVNGVLRNIARNIDSVIYPDKNKDIIKYLSVVYSCPEWIIKMWTENYSADIVERMLKSFCSANSTYIRCNTNKVTPQVLEEHLEQEGVIVEKIILNMSDDAVKNALGDVEQSSRKLHNGEECLAQEHPASFDGKRYIYQNGFKISGYDYLWDLQSFKNGEFQVQDISSMLAGEGNIIKTDDYIIDVCAAPGGKSINAALKATEGKVDSRDVSENKIALIESNLERLGIGNVTCKVWDAAVKDETAVERADVVIADLPCSGLGIIGRKPDIKYNASPEKLESLAKLQRDILSVVWEYVKPGGYLIYSTCTVNKGENEENVKWFTDNYPFEPVQECVTLLPGINGTDGFFIARLRRKTAL